MKLCLSLITFILLLSNASFAQKMKEHKADDYEIQYPEEWDLDVSGMMGTKFLILAPRVGGVFFRPNVTLNIQESEGLDLNAFGKKMEAAVPKFTTKPDILSSRLVAKGKKQYYELIYTGTQGANFLKKVQHIYAKGTEMWILSISLEGTSGDEKAPPFAEIVNSFRIY